MIGSRRQDLGLGKTAGGGSGGSFASHSREAGAPPAPVLITPNFSRLLDTDPESWFATPWSQRKEVIEQATIEIIRCTPEARHPPFGTALTFGRWMQSNTSLAWNKQVTCRVDPSLNENLIELSAPQLRTKEPRTIADTILHEVAHGIDDKHSGHSKGWREKFRTLLNRHGMSDVEVRMNHQSTAAELAAPVHVMRRYRGTCPNDQSHTSYRDGMPRTRSYICTRGDCRSKPQSQRLITYDRNPDFNG
ncbi:SprT family zinc-dependent metalloprotease [Leucobacter luti]|nr:SprT family zinc-dependent metalloprotease [Leucobacter luti]